MTESFPRTISCGSSTHWSIYPSSTKNSKRTTAGIPGGTPSRRSRSSSTSCSRQSTRSRMPTLSSAADTICPSNIFLGCAPKMTITEDSAGNLADAKDKDARVGHKTTDNSFFGYKTHIAMTDERIITAATVTRGEKGGGAELAALVGKSRKTELTVKSVIGDTAYSGKKNLALAASKEAPEKGFDLIAKLNPVISDSSREEGAGEFSYNKDAQMFVCPAGHIATRKVNQNKKGTVQNRSEEQ